MYYFEEVKGLNCPRKFIIKISMGNSFKNLFFVNTEREASLCTAYLNDPKMSSNLEESTKKFLNKYIVKEIILDADCGEFINKYLRRIIDTCKKHKEKGWVFKITGSFNEVNFEITDLPEFDELKTCYSIICNNDIYEKINLSCGCVYKEIYRGE